MTTKQADRIAKNLFGENAFAEAKGGYRNIGIRNGMRWTPLARVGAREPQAWMKAIFLAQKQAIINAR